MDKQILEKHLSCVVKHLVGQVGHGISTGLHDVAHIVANNKGADQDAYICMGSSSPFMAANMNIKNKSVG